MNKSWSKIALVAVLVALVVGFFYSGATEYLTLDYLKSQKDNFAEFYENNRAMTFAAYAVGYILVTSLSLPGAAILTLAGGAVFGVALGTVVVSFASTIGATCAFLVSRYLLQGAVQEKFGDKLKKINQGIQEEGAFYLFTLRLVPAFPFFVINLVMGITPIRTVVFFFVSQIGMLPGTIVYVNAGTQLAQIEAVRDILSIELIGSFVLLGVFPIIAKKLVGLLRPRLSKE
ncbi:TVP38/TMEM64 family protein [Pseudobacteriovorax antillogorgiicola]|uniref:TVP38/TMEM64 family membrane protein n=1 Tax=Pseudobacteriovorax antillogorgiicola TaxID=1513793 RepID=A0A1Y6B7I1_9BACT|nr:TVP38/TMEM64 family protein [Pseudobacteriovorax antillogorgiicola]TCS59337.1 putative membrane protein YdjX (TVP38/TMEM64 family) [Pseudobacteriovorax antillogorgiicola]SME89204.1 Uncharacterized membrane protein YdjX, TVP38/TMEM64 family, SNARE-associated domain [Pseudobacteriovorax antillogorgiicola]